MITSTRSKLLLLNLLPGFQLLIDAICTNLAPYSGLSFKKLVHL